MAELKPLEQRANKVADLVQFTPDFDFLGAKPYVFHALDAPIVQITAPHAPVPFSPSLERLYVPGPQRIEAGIRQVLQG